MMLRVCQEESLDGWKIARNIDGQDRPEFILRQIMLEPMMKFKVKLLCTFICLQSSRSSTVLVRVKRTCRYSLVNVVLMFS